MYVWWLVTEVCSKISFCTYEVGCRGPSPQQKLCSDLRDLPLRSMIIISQHNLYSQVDTQATITFPQIRMISEVNPASMQVRASEAEHSLISFAHHNQSLEVTLSSITTNLSDSELQDKHHCIAHLARSLFAFFYGINNLPFINGISLSARLTSQCPVWAFKLLTPLWRSSFFRDRNFYYGHWLYKSVEKGWVHPLMKNAVCIYRVSRCSMSKPFVGNAYDTSSFRRS